MKPKKQIEFLVTEVNITLSAIESSTFGLIFGLPSNAINNFS